jgi:hypothetical protein
MILLPKLTTESFSQRVDFAFFIGAGVSLFLFNVSVFNYSNTGSPMIFPLVTFCTYVGVIIREIIDQRSFPLSSLKSAVLPNSSTHKNKLFNRNPMRGRMRDLQDPNKLLRVLFSVKCV